ncbi:MAG: transcriptional regulator [Actinomycetes bacterium]
MLLPQGPYTYLLGLYLGDGCLSAGPRDVYRLRIACAERYPGLIRQCELAMAEVLPNKVNRTRKRNERCWDVYSFSKHWPCLFPQHGPGRKHERKIELTGWQQELVDLDPRPLVRGLLHSDGCRVLNWVNGTPYPRYHFSNVSADIRGIFGRACDQLGIEWRPNNRFSLSMARRESVALLDEFVGPKR